MSYEDPDRGSANITLRCEVPLLKNGLQTWDNVSYRITWYSEGKLLHTDNTCGDLAPKAKKYDNPCPGKPLISKLNGSMYSLHRSVSVCGFYLPTLEKLKDKVTPGSTFFSSHHSIRANVLN